MRILCIGSMYPPHHLGGYELVWQAAVEHLRGQGHAVRVVCSDHRETAEVPADDACRDLRWYWHDHAFPRRSLRETIELERANAQTFARQADEFSPDVVAWWAMGGMSLSLLAQAGRRGLPAVAFVNDDWLIYGPKVDAWIRLADRPWIPRSLLERATGLPARFDPAVCERIVFASESTRASALKRWDLPRTEVAHGGIDPDFLTGMPSTRPWAWRLLYVGRIDPRKGVRTLLEAVAAIPQASLEIVGGGEAAHLAELRAQADGLDLGDRVTFTGQRERTDLPAIYAAADAVVFPVLWAEPWGLVPLEAMACGTPVVATGTGGSAEYLRADENCLLFAPGKADQLVERLVRLAGDAALRRRLQSGGVKTARANTDAAFNDRVGEVLGEVSGRGADR